VTVINNSATRVESPEPVRAEPVRAGPVKAGPVKTSPERASSEPEIVYADQSS